VTVIIPNAKIASRWNGALQARLKSAPLEAFLRSHGQKWVASGETRMTDNLACATIYLVGGGIGARGEGAPQTLSEAEHPAVGQLSCAVAADLALMIQEPTYWRTAALVATARILEKYIGLSAAAHVAAAAARDYSTDVNAGTLNAEIATIARAVRGAVEDNADEQAAQVVHMIAEHLTSVSARFLSLSLSLSPPVALAYDPGTAAVSSSTT